MKTYFYSNTHVLEEVQKLQTPTSSDTNEDGVLGDLESSNYIYYTNYATNGVIEIKQ